MACRNLKKGEKALQEVITLTKNPEVSVMELDLSSFRSIHSFCIDFKSKHQTLDILINNAGYFKYDAKEYPLTQDNLELTFMVNTVGPFMLSYLLLDLLKQADDPRILNACSTNIRHFFDPNRKIDFENLQGQKNNKAYNGYKMYGDSKMALLMLTFKMAEEFKPDGIKVNAVQIPSVSMSEETKNKFKGIWKLLATLQNPFALPKEKMAYAYYGICTSDEFKNINGKLIDSKQKIVKPSQYKSDPLSVIKQLFDQTVYPKYADNRENIENAWNFARETTKTVGITPLP